jgi:hypothetical protein
VSGLLPFPPHDTWEAIQVLFLLFVGHALMDYPLQGEFLSTCEKPPSALQAAGSLPSEGNLAWCMSAHCLIHAVTAWAITGCFLLCVIKFILHWIIDFAKCENLTTFNLDQALHYLCKIAYLIVAMLV